MRREARDGLSSHSVVKPVLFDRTRGGRPNGRGPVAKSGHTATLWALLVLAGVSLVACGEPREAGEPQPTGSTVELAGIEYRVELSRQLNPNIPPDKDFFRGRGARPGSLLFGVFLEACNEEREAASAAGDFTLLDVFGKRFEPLELAEDNVFAYEPRRLEPGECIPREGTAADRAASGALVVFEVPVQTLQNRPLELEISGPRRTTARVELDI